MRKGPPGDWRFFFVCEIKVLNCSHLFYWSLVKASSRKFVRTCYELGLSQLSTSLENC